MTTCPTPLTPDALRMLEAQLNRGYLAWYFVGRRDPRAIEALLADVYESYQTDAA